MASRVAFLIVSAIGSMASASCVLDFEQVGPAAGGGAGAEGLGGAGASMTSSGAESPGGSPSGGGGAGGDATPVTHDCTDLPSACVTPPADLFVLTETCAAPVFTGGVGDGANALEAEMIDCNCDCDGSCKATVGRYLTDNCLLNELALSFDLFNGECTNMVPGFEPDEYHRTISASYECTGVASPDFASGFKRPIAGCNFATEGCDEPEQVCLSTSAPVCMYKPEGGCPSSFKTEVRVLELSAIPASVCECSCKKGDDDACPTELTGGNVCNGATVIDCTQAQAFSYSGEGPCTPNEQEVTTGGLVSTKLCCNKAPPPAP